MLLRLLRSAFSPRSSAAPLIQRALDLRARGEFAEAERVLRSAVKDHPHNAIAATNLAVALLEQDQAQEAVALLQRAIEIDKRCAAAHFNYANVLRVSGRLAEAIEHYRAAKNADSEFAAAPEELMHTLLEACDWDGARSVADELRERVARSAAEHWMRFVSPLTAGYLQLGPDTCKRVAAYHAQASFPIRGKGGMGVVSHPSHRGRAVASEAERNERIRLAYFSRDFRDHAVGHVLRGVLALHDRSRFEVHAFSFGPDDGSVYRKAIAASVDRFVNVADKSDDEAARAISEAGIDVLVDLMGHTTGNRLGVLARRPAPVQVHYLGYAGTTGASYIDYFVTDAIAAPPRLKHHYTERISYVPDCFMVSDGKDALAAPTATRDEQKLPRDAYVFCNFANPSRIDRETFELWMQILEAVPHGVLWLKRSHTLVVENLRREAQTRGVDPGRLLFAERVADKPAHLGRLALADLALDTIGWHNGHSSTADMLWAGVPVLTSPGETFASRVAASLVCASGVHELVVTTPADYVNSAIDLASDRAHGEALREKLAAARNSAPFFDTPRLVRGLETAYEAMYADKIRAPAGL